MVRVNDGKWHALHLDREGSSGSLALDGETNSFVIPGGLTLTSLFVRLYMEFFCIFQARPPDCT